MCIAEENRKVFLHIATATGTGEKFGIRYEAPVFDSGFFTVYPAPYEALGAEFAELDEARAHMKLMLKRRVPAEAFSLVAYPDLEAVQTYVQEGTGRCPVCHSSQITGEYVDISGRYGFQENTCHDCGANWTVRMQVETIIMHEPGNQIDPDEEDDEEEAA